MNANFILSICVIILAFMIMILALRIDLLIKHINKLESELLDNDLYLLRLMAKNKKGSNNDKSL